jgi:oligopeptidase A
MYIRYSTLCQLNALIVNRATARGAMIESRLARIAGLMLLLIAMSAMGESNPLLSNAQLPDFKAISPSDFAPAIDNVLQSYNDKLVSIGKLPASWDNTVQPLEEATNSVTRVWNLISMLNSLNATDDIKAAYNVLLPKISSFYSTILHNIELYQSYSIIKSSQEYDKFNDQQKAVILKMLLAFKLNGADLNAEEKERFKQISIRLDELSKSFTNNLAAASSSWSYEVKATELETLVGIPDSVVAAAAAKAASQGKTGWILTLDYPCFDGVISYARNRSLREKIYTAYSTLASDQDKDPTHSKWDNGPVIKEILALRQELAVLLGFNNYAEYVLADKELSSIEKVLEFLNDLATKSKAAAEIELNVIKSYAKENKESVKDLQNWDLSYYSELYKQEHYPVSLQDTRKYFSEDHVFTGLFDTVNIIYSINIQQVKDANVWHPSVKLFEIKDRNNTTRGYFYTDLYSRDLKTTDSWTMNYLSRLRYSDGSLQLPVSTICTNFMPGQPGLLTYYDVINLFGEFGKMLEHTLSLVDYPSISGSNRVAKDVDLFASDFMRRWAWEAQVVSDISKNISSGDELPKQMFDNLLSVKNFNAGILMLNKVEFASFDFRIHQNLLSDKGKSPMDILNEIRKQVAVIPAALFDRLPNRFEEIFTGDLAGCYYGPLWSKALAADAITSFREGGVFNSQIGTKFLNTILEEGGEKSLLDLFVDFRGRDPNANALLIQSGIIAGP